MNTANDNRTADAPPRCAPSGGSDASRKSLARIATERYRDVLANVTRPATGSTFEWAKHNDGTVQSVLDAGGTLEDVIVALVKQKHELAEKCMKYVLIAPKKIKMADGSFRVWRCPDELVPEM